MKQIKKGMLILFILIFCIYIIPDPIKKEIIETTTTIVEETIDKITSRSQNEPRKEEEHKSISKSYELSLKTDLTTITNISAEEYNKMLAKTKLKGIGQAVYDAEHKYNVNGLYIIGLACLESNYGKSNFAIKRNNLFGWNAVDSNPGKASTFKSKESCIMYVTEKLSKSYLNEKGCYYSGKTAKDIDKHYCTDKQHANKIIKIINKLVKEIK